MILDLRFAHFEICSHFFDNCAFVCLHDQISFTSLARYFTFDSKLWSFLVYARLGMIGCRSLLTRVQLLQNVEPLSMYIIMSNEF